MDDLKKTIERTKNYARIYGQKLNDEQLFLRLISPKIYRFIQIKGKGTKKTDRSDWQNKFSKAKLLTEKYLINMKGILMVAVTGSVAAEFAFKNEDIDLLIVTKNNELWWWRLYLRFFIWWHKIPHRKYGKKETANEFCFNLWLDEDNLAIPRQKRNLKNAADLIMMKVIMEKNGTYDKFLKNNYWVNKYLATGYEERMKISRKIDKKINSKNKNSLMKVINKILFKGQCWYMQVINKQKLNKGEINFGQAFFHKNS